jgi:uncharacterized protein YbjT (DUF2867 family)
MMRLDFDRLNDQATLDLGLSGVTVKLCRACARKRLVLTLTDPRKCRSGSPQSQRSSVVGIRSKSQLACHTSQCRFVIPAATPHMGDTDVKIVVIGGTGLVGRQLVAILIEQGLDAIAAAPSIGVDTLSGAGLAGALAGAHTVVDVSNAPSFEDAAVLDFFAHSASNLTRAARAAGVRRIVALSVVGTDRLQASSYFRAKQAQERIIAASGVPFTIVRATQFYEFMATIAAGYTDGDLVRLPTFALQPIASCDVAEALADVVTAPATGRTIEIAGPERAALAEFVGTWLGEHDDPRAVTFDDSNLYFGASADDATLVPGEGARIMPTRFDAWLSAQRRSEAA